MSNDAASIAAQRRLLMSLGFGFLNIRSRPRIRRFAFPGKNPPCPQCLRGEAFSFLALIAMLLAASVASAQKPYGDEKGSSSYINISTLFVDSESGVMSTTNNLLRPGAFFDFYTEDGLLVHYDGMGAVQRDTDDPPGTFYVYRMGVDLMDGEVMGYSNMGDGVFFHPTVPIPASQTPELKWLRDDAYFGEGFGSDCINRIIDRVDRPAIALGNALSGSLVSNARFSITATYLEGNSLSGTQEYTFPKGNITELAIVAWGAVPAPDPRVVLFGPNIPYGPLKVDFKPDEYTTATLSAVGLLHRTAASDVVFRPTTGVSATQYLDQKGWSPTVPPKWILRMALRDKLCGKTKWLYPPLDRYADVNGDGVLDVADLIAVNLSAGAKGIQDHEQ